jgi:hypothetical protein
MPATIKKYFIPFVVVILLFLSCSKTPVPPVQENNCDPSAYDLGNSLVGMWKSDAVIVGIDTIHNSSTSVVLQVNKEEWNDRLHIQPVQTIFNPNKTYVSAYTTTDGKVIKVTAGKWDVGKNQLNIHQLFPNDKQMNYRIDLSDGFAELRSKLDFDGDGKQDDIFYCQMKKITPNG